MPAFNLQTIILHSRNTVVSRF